MRVVPLSVSALAIGSSLLFAPPALAGWTSPRSLPYEGFSPVSAAIDPRGRGAVVGDTATVDPATGDVISGIVTARLRGGTALGPPRTELLGVSANDLDVDASGASVISARRFLPGVPNPDGSVTTFPEAQQIISRETLAPFGVPIDPAPAARTGSLLVARNGVGDLAAAWQLEDGTVLATVRRKGGGFENPTILSQAGVSGLTIAFARDRTVVAGWVRDSAAEVRVREPDGSAGVGSILGGAPGETRNVQVAVAAGDGGRALAAASIPVPGQDLQQLVSVDRPARGAFAGRKLLDTAKDLSAPQASIGGRERLVAWRRGNGANLAYVRAAGRRGSKPLRLLRLGRVVGAKGVSGDRVIGTNVRAAVASDGGAVVAFNYHGAVHAAVREPGRKRFAAPRAVSALGGGTISGGSFPVGHPLAVARGGRAILAFPRVGDLRPQVAVLRRGGKDRSTRKGAIPPKLQWGRPSFDLTSNPARISIPIDCDRACRTSFAFSATGRGTSGTATVRRVVSRKGSRTLVGFVTPRFDRFLRRNDGRTLRSTRIVATAVTRYGGQTTERRIYRDLAVPTDTGVAR